MATVRHPLHINLFVPAATAGPQLKCVAGTNFPVFSLAFDAAADETAYTTLKAIGYGSGNLSLIIDWRADTAALGDVIFGAAIAAITPDADSTDLETKAFATATTVTDTCLGLGRVMRTTLTISNLDSLAADDRVDLKLYRDADAAGDTMVGDAEVVGAEVTYSDT